MDVRAMQRAQLESALAVWRAASVLRGRPADGARLELARTVLTQQAGSAYVAGSPQVIGFIVIELPRDDGGEAGDRADAAEISMLFVHPSGQRSGVGTALVEHAFGVVAARAVARVQVWTGVDNPQAQRFYSSLGMNLTGRRVPGGLSEQLEFELVLARSAADERPTIS